MAKKKVITVNGDSNKWYEKVIFVVKKDSGAKEKNVDFVAEAEKIIADYMLTSDMAYSNTTTPTLVKTRKKGKPDGIDIFLIVSICICLTMMLALFISK